MKKYEKVNDWELRVHKDLCPHTEVESRTPRESGSKGWQRKDCTYSSVSVDLSEGHDETKPDASRSRSTTGLLSHIHVTKKNH